MTCKLELISVGNGDRSYPGNFTKKEKELILKHAKNPILNLFSGRSTIGKVRIDFACKEATLNCDVFEYLQKTNIHDFNTVIIDAPYNQRFADKYQKIHFTPKQFIIFASVQKTNTLFSLINEKINPEILIIKSWNYYIPKGFDRSNSFAFLCYAGGYRKPTILMICKKKEEELK